VEAQDVHAPHGAQAGRRGHAAPGRLAAQRQAREQVVGGAPQVALARLEFVLQARARLRKPRLGIGRADQQADQAREQVVDVRCGRVEGDLERLQAGAGLHPRIALGEPGRQRGAVLGHAAALQERLGEQAAQAGLVGRLVHAADAEHQPSQDAARGRQFGQFQEHQARAALEFAHARRRRRPGPALRTRAGRSRGAPAVRQRDQEREACGAGHGRGV
jgi:hypothetical protein